MRPRLKQIINKTSSKYPGYPFYVSSDDIKSDDEPRAPSMADEPVNAGTSFHEDENRKQENVRARSLPLDEHAVREEDVLALEPKDFKSRPF